ncbi:hypothetical protein ES703_73689 [subsurface metagenome]
MIDATWVGISILTALNIAGWVFSYVKYSRNEARHLGLIEGKLDGLHERMESLEGRMGNLEQRLDSLKK